MVPLKAARQGSSQQVTVSGALGKRNSLCRQTVFRLTNWSEECCLNTIRAGSE